MKQANWKIDNLEFRTTGEHLINDGNLTTGKIVQWGESYCWVIAYWTRDNDGFHLEFVGNRPFSKDVNQNDFFILARYGQEYLTQSETE